MCIIVWIILYKLKYIKVLVWNKFLILNTLKTRKISYSIIKKPNYVIIDLNSENNMK